MARNGLSWLIVFVLSSIAPVYATNLTLCVDNNFWYPFTFVKDNKAQGLHLDIIKQAALDLKYTLELKPMPWQECLDACKQGLVDGAATASYRDERTAYLRYPEGAAGDYKSPWRVTQVEYVVITSTTQADGLPNNYRFEGYVKGLPTPVRVNTGYSLANDFKKIGLEIKEGNPLSNFKDLVKSQQGSIVDLEEVANFYSKQKPFTDKLIIHTEPVSSKSYFLVFAKKGQVKTDVAYKFWQQIAKIRDNNELINKFLHQY